MKIGPLRKLDRPSLTAHDARGVASAKRPLKIVADRALADRARPGSARLKSPDRSVISPIEPAEKVPAAEVRTGSDRSFGFVMAAFFALVALWPLVRGGEMRLWSLALTAGFAVSAALRPSLLHPLNRVWFRFGLLLHRVISPIILGALFFGILTPIAALMRVARTDILGLRFDRTARSYWDDRSDSKPGSMRRQF